MTCKQGDIVLVPFQYTDSYVKKKRPALVVSRENSSHLICVMITSTRIRTPYDVEINEDKRTGLLKKSIVRTNKVFTVDQNIVEKKLGFLPEDNLKKAMNAFLSLFLENNDGNKCASSPK